MGEGGDIARRVRRLAVLSRRPVSKTSFLAKQKKKKKLRQLYSEWISGNVCNGHWTILPCIAVAQSLLLTPLSLHLLTHFPPSPGTTCKATGPVSVRAKTFFDDFSALWFDNSLYVTDFRTNSTPELSTSPDSGANPCCMKL